MKKATALATILAVGLASSPAAAARRPPPLPAPSAFGAGTINPYFPLVPNTTTVYGGVIDGVPASETFTVTDKLKMVDGIPATVIRDSLYLEREQGHGQYLAEFTIDWYATANNGDVWYLGEKTSEYDEAGQVISTDGSWQAGVDGAEAGIFMPADPRVGVVYQQESATDAQDLFKITSLAKGEVTTREWTPLEPGLVTRKVFRPGVGMTVEDTIKGAAIEDLLLTLVRVEHP